MAAREAVVKEAGWAAAGWAAAREEVDSGGAHEAATVAVAMVVDLEAPPFPFEADGSVASTSAPAAAAAQPAAAAAAQPAAAQPAAAPGSAVGSFDLRL